jgi:hypothetical protein
MVVDQEDLIKIPSHMSYQEASTLPIACGTAWNILYGNTATVMSGDTVLCMGTGGVSVFTAAVSYKMRAVVKRLISLLLPDSAYGGSQGYHDLILGRKARNRQETPRKLDHDPSSLPNHQLRQTQSMGPGSRPTYEWRKGGFLGGDWRP